MITISEKEFDGIVQVFMADDYVQSVFQNKAQYRKHWFIYDNNKGYRWL